MLFPRSCTHTGLIPGSGSWYLVKDGVAPDLGKLMVCSWMVMCACQMLDPKGWRGKNNRH